MENDGPVSAVQIRLAKGEISASQYKEILTHLMKNVSSFQQTSSLKILQLRYAKSELTADEYQESLKNLMRNLYSHPWSPPLQILHNRYAQGEIDSLQYEEMFTNLTHEDFAYDKATPLWIINNRYARGELTTEEYEEILNLFTDYTLSLQQFTMIPPDDTVRISRSEKKDIRSDQPAGIPRSAQNISQSQKKTENSVHEPGEADLIPVQTEKIQTRETSASPVQDIISEPLQGDIIAVDEDIIRSGVSDPLPGSGEDSFSEDRTAFDLSDSDQNDSEVISDSGSLSHPSGDEFPIVSDIVHPDEKPAGLSGVIESADQKTGTLHPPQSIHFPASLSQPGLHHAGEALPTDFLYPGGKHGAGMVAEEAVLPSSPEVRVDYSITPVTSAGGRVNTYETVTSSISHSLPEKGISPSSSETESSDSKKTVVNTPTIRQQIKTLIVKGEYDDAIKLADQMIGEDNQDYLPFFYKGMARYYLNIHTEALEDLEQARKLCKNKDEIRKIDTIRDHILTKQKKIDQVTSTFPDSDQLDISDPPLSEEGAKVTPDDTLSQTLDALGKKAQDLIDNKEYRSAKDVLSEFIQLCSDLPKDRLLAESVDEIYAAMGYVRYQLKDYSNAKDCFQNALSVNPENEVANQFMKDILIRAARKK